MSDSYIGFDGYKPSPVALAHANRVLKVALESDYPFTVNPCLTGNTVIATLDGPRTFKELADAGEDVRVYSWHPATKRPVVRWMRNPHRTGTGVPVMRVEFDSGLSVECTYNHGFYTFRGEKVEARDLHVGQSLRAFSASRDISDHERIHAWDSATDRAVHQWTHRMVWECEYGQIPDGLQVAHMDGDGSNNDLDNLALMTDLGHRRYDMPKRQANGMDGHCRNHKVIEVSDAGFADVYNGMVEDSHTYIILDPEPVSGHMSGIVSANCGEIPLAVWGGFCLIGDLVPYHALFRTDGWYRHDWKDLLFSAGREMARFLVRTNLMRSLYKREVERTNRIGVSLTGVHEFAWKQWGLTFRELIDPDNNPKAQEFWDCLKDLSRAITSEAIEYSRQLDLADPDTTITIKPSGSVSKLFSLTEGWHLPSKLAYLRWVQYVAGDHLIDEYRQRGYPVRGPLKTYKDTFIVGFPTITKLAEIMPENLIVTAAQATFDEQCKWVELGEKYWIGGGGGEFKRFGGQISYTLKYDPDTISMREFHKKMAEWMPKLKALSVMPQEKNANAYEYYPEELITVEQYTEITANIDREDVSEDIGYEHLECEGGACPIEYGDKI